MRRLIFILAVLLIAGSVFATGTPETEEVHKLILVDTGTNPWDNAQGAYDTGGFSCFQDLVLDNFRQTHPNIEVTYIHRDTTQGSMTTDALFAKGTPPDVWLDAAGYFRELLNGDDSLALEQYMDLSGYQQHLVDLYTVGGHVYALPVVNVVTGLGINTSMLEEIGYTLPAQADWTTDEFLRLAEKLKQAGYPATMIMTQQGLITWDIVWLYAFGAELYKDGDYSRVAINTPEAVAGLEYMKLLVDRGYTPPFPNEVNDDMGVELFTTGKVFSCMLQTGHADYWVPEQLKNGVIDEVFGYTFIEFPHGPGVAHTPVSGYQVVVNARRSDNEARNLATIELFKTQVGVEYQTYTTTIQGAFPTLTGFEVPNIGAAAKPSYAAMQNVAASTGLMDLGGMHPRAKEVMAAWKIPIQLFMDGKITAQEVLDRFEAEANAILAD